MTKKELGRFRYLQNSRRQAVIAMRLEGRTYQEIGDIMGVSRQRVEQLASPPVDTLEELISRSGAKCQDCGIFVGKSGHAHHKGKSEDSYADISQLIYLCISCHRRAHALPAEKIICQQCGKEYMNKISQGRKFCSWKCFVDSEGHASHRQRDLAIFRYVAAGQLSHCEIGAKYGLSAARVSQIAARMAEERKAKK
jgi:DNA-directed RNA polymerase subunit RPC12/RpoP